ncbi:hypothetical protein RTBOTA2_002277 [Rhodotorula toruloides]|nr:hypothetical protein RTBOTA2_002277 [Rhodotorula toruloides]
MQHNQHTPFYASLPLDSTNTMFASPAQFDPYAFAHIATGSPSPSTASSSSSASPSLFDLPSPRSMPISTPSPSSSSSLALPFYPDTHTGRSSSYDSALGDFPSSATTSTGGMTINPSLLFGADLCAPAPTDSFLSSSAPSSSSSSSHPFFPSSSPPQPLPPPLFGESTTPQQRRAQVAALSSLVVVKPAPSSAGPVKRGKGAARTRSLSQGRAAATDRAQRGRRASANDTVDEGAKSAKSWLDALKQAEIKAKLRRLQSQPQFDGPPTPGSGGRMAQLQSQLLAQSMAPQSGAGIVAQCEASTAMLGGAAFPWVR